MGDVVLALAAELGDDVVFHLEDHAASRDEPQLVAAELSELLLDQHIAEASTRHQLFFKLVGSSHCALDELGLAFVDPGGDVACELSDAFVLELDLGAGTLDEPQGVGPDGGDLLVVEQVHCTLALEA